MCQMGILSNLSFNFPEIPKVLKNWKILVRRDFYSSGRLKNDLSASGEMKASSFW